MFSGRGFDARSGKRFSGGSKGDGTSAAIPKKRRNDLCHEACRPSAQRGKGCLWKKHILTIVFYVRSGRSTTCLIRTTKRTMTTATIHVIGTATRIATTATTFTQLCRVLTGALDELGLIRATAARRVQFR